MFSFWTAVSAIECIGLIRRYHQFARRKVWSYALSKFAFTLLRNLALWEGRSLYSYADIRDWATLRFDAIPVERAYAVKIGALAELNVNEAMGLLQLRPLLRVPPPVTDVAGDILQAFMAGEDLDFARYTRLASHLAHEESLLRVLEYEQAKFGITVVG